MNDQFYFQGKYFDNQNEFWKYVREWNEMQTNQETIDRLMNKLKKDIQLNIGFYDIKITNSQLNVIIEHGFVMMMKKIMNVPKEIKDSTHEILDNALYTDNNNDNL